MHVTVLIPSFGRPGYLRRAIEALQSQTRPPDSIVVVTRDTDLESARTVDGLDAGIHLIHGEVSRPGHLPPLERGRQLLPAATQAVVILDDDAALAPDGLARAAALLARPDVGGVAGRIVELDDGARRPVGTSRDFGRVSINGRIIGNYELDCPDDAIRDVWFARGAIMAYRREAFDRIVIRERLNRDVAVHYEVDWGLQVRAMGYRFLYDPRLMVEHANAPRIHGTQRSAAGAEVAFWTAHNTTYVLLHHMRGPARWIFLGRNFVVGEKRNWGLGAALFYALARRSLEWRGALMPAYRGKVAGLRSYLEERRATS
jgi:GT2 family glycosyltransferase